MRQRTWILHGEKWSISTRIPRECCRFQNSINMKTERMRTISNNLNPVLGCSNILTFGPCFFCLVPFGMAKGEGEQLKSIIPGSGRNVWGQVDCLVIDHPNELFETNWHSILKTIRESGFWTLSITFLGNVNESINWLATIVLPFSDKFDFQVSGISWFFFFFFFVDGKNIVHMEECTFL